MKFFREIFKVRNEVSVRYDKEHSAVWLYLNPSDRPRYSIQMLNSMLDTQKAVISYFKHSQVQLQYPIKYFIFASQVNGIYNYGGDLEHFAKMIINKDKEQLQEYAHKCIDVVYLSAVNLHSPITTITLLEGDALGGGFESALSTSVLIAQEDVKMGFPEIRFNMFPGMGAYSFLARYHGMKFAQEIISSGKVYSARMLYEKGVVHKLVKKGKGVQEVCAFMKKYSRFSNGMQGIQKVEQIYKPLSYNELIKITDLWVETALNIRESDIKMMYKLVKAQNRKKINHNKIRTNFDRRIIEVNDLMDNLPYERRKCRDRRIAV